MATARRQFTREFKLEAVRLVTEEGHSLAEVARDLDLRADMIRRWRRQFADDPRESFPGVGHRKPSDEEVAQLKRELARVKQERDILKKALGIVSDRPR